VKSYGTGGVAHPVGDGGAPRAGAMEGHHFQPTAKKNSLPKISLTSSPDMALEAERHDGITRHTSAELCG